GRVLDDYRIANHELWPGDPGELVVGEIPRFDAEDHAERLGLDACTLRFGDRLRLQIALSTHCVIVENRGRERNLATRLGDQFARFKSYQSRKVFGILPPLRPCAGAN